MKRTEPEQNIANESNNSRRKFLRIAVSTGAVPGACLLDGCASKSAPWKPGFLPGKDPTLDQRTPSDPDPFPGRIGRQERVSERVKWDFHRLIIEIKNILLVHGGDKQDIDNFIRSQKVVVKKGMRSESRDLNVLDVKYELICESLPSGKIVPVGIEISGCMLRGDEDHNRDQPESASCCDDAARRANDQHGETWLDEEGPDDPFRFDDDHLVYSSSSSSSNWGS